MNFIEEDVSKWHLTVLRPSNFLQVGKLCVRQVLNFGSPLERFRQEHLQSTLRSQNSVNEEFVLRIIEQFN